MLTLFCHNNIWGEYNGMGGNLTERQYIKRQKCDSEDIQL